MSGFWGSFSATLDTKGRINVPAKFRKNLREDDDDTLILIRSRERCIALYPQTAWRDTIDELKAKVDSQREFGIVSRRLMFQASEQRIDKQGRVTLSAPLIDYAGLNGEIMIVGYENKIEIWDPARYREFVESTEADYLNIVRDLDL